MIRVDKILDNQLGDVDWDSRSQVRVYSLTLIYEAGTSHYPKK